MSIDWVWYEDIVREEETRQRDEEERLRREEAERLVDILPWFEDTVERAPPPIPNVAFDEFFA